MFDNNIEEKMEKIPFTVSSRAAILIGRENIATTRAAIIELVKNCYDADSSFCLIYIDNKYSTVKKELDSQELKILIDKGIDLNLIHDLYSNEEEKYILKDVSKNKEESKIQQKKLNEYQSQLKKLATLYIIDSGEGMTREVVTNNWMTIGTDNKVLDYKSKKNRIKSGAKGIGRFALDKLGSNCLMVSNSVQTGDSKGIVWRVDWRDFEKPNKIINEINAEIEETGSSNLRDHIKSVLPDLNIDCFLNKLKDIELSKYEAGLINKENLKFQDLERTLINGTCFEIHNLHEIWKDTTVNQLYNDLEILVPPREVTDFSIYFYSSLEPNKYGEVLTSTGDDFDYKLVANVDEDQNVTLTIFREEFDIEIIPDDFYELELIKESKFANRENFQKKIYQTQYTLSNFLPGLNNMDILSKIGKFDFIFYFMKKTQASNETERYFYKTFEASERKQWLDKFGGLKIYRDNFRVRPYGEMKDPAFDWLGLGARKTASPAAVSRIGGYKVQPDQVSGIINISRLSNFEFNDKSSREGLQETETFKAFRNIILNIISKFEEDRSFIMNQLKHYDDLKYGAVKDLEKAKKLAESILKNEKEKIETNNKSQDNIHQNEERHTKEDFERIRLENIVLAQYAKSKQEEVEKLSDEQKLLRGLASSGILSASLGHHLSKIRNNLYERHATLAKLLSTKVTPELFKDTPPFMNPYIYLDEMREDDKKIVEWLGFSLGFTRKDKRKRKLFILDQYLLQLKNNWKNTLHDRSIDLFINCPQDLTLRAFELDFDSIFINLLTNSIDAFSLPSKRKESRKIWIECKKDNDLIYITFRDNGPGLSKDIINPDDIFTPMFTTKKDHSSGDDTGTGLGMWIINSVVKEYDGKTFLLSKSQNEHTEENGFGLRIQLPIKFTKAEI